MAGHQPLREEVYVERLITSLAYHRTEDEAATVTTHPRSWTLASTLTFDSEFVNRIRVIVRFLAQKTPTALNF